MPRNHNPLGLTPRTCAWLPCQTLLPAESYGRFCSTNHRVLAHTEAKRLAALLRDLQDADHNVSRALVHGIAGSGRRQQTLEAWRRRVEERLQQLRPDVRPPTT